MNELNDLTFSSASSVLPVSLSLLISARLVSIYFLCFNCASDHLICLTISGKNADLSKSVPTIIELAHDKPVVLWKFVSAVSTIFTGSIVLKKA